MIMMNFVAFVFFIFVVLLLPSASKHACRAQDPFNKNYYPTWGTENLILVNQGLEAQLLFNQHSGTGFASKSEFGSGFFEIKLKLPYNPNGIVTTFYLTNVHNGRDVRGVNHFEFDIEFFGKRLSTNVFANDKGGREQAFNLWFDPSADFHTYQILWNQHQTAWFVDGEAVRVWKNISQLGVAFPTERMHIEASVWTASFAGKVDWSKAPLVAHYSGFNVNGCVYDSAFPHNCYSETLYYWNEENFWLLNPTQKAHLANHRKNHMYHDYCNGNPKADFECRANQ